MCNWFGNEASQLAAAPVQVFAFTLRRSNARAASAQTRRSQSAECAQTLALLAAEELFSNANTAVGFALAARRAI